MTDANNKPIIPDSNQVVQLVAGPVVQTRLYTLFYGKVLSPTGDKLVVDASADANFYSALACNGTNDSVEQATLSLTASILSS
ncbi:MAG: hypothetical protein EOO61_14430 [Hymenobacter sp.]|nr:MAG: hypothetical protein EOO61_14430 [Hymenobacter sp.]